jgi:phosphatidylinositol-3-phosphatase
MAMTIRNLGNRAKSALLCGAFILQAGMAGAAPAAMPHYDHVFLIILENHSMDEIIGPKSDAPELNRLAQDYGLASNFYAIRHPSEPNYVAMIGGDTFGISDDDAIYCKVGSTQAGCEKSSKSGYVDHTVDAPNLAQQLDAQGIAWKGYFEDIPEPGSLVWHWPSPQQPVAGKPDSLYASKHNGFVTFKSVQNDPHRAEKIVGFDVLDRDLAGSTLPRFAVIVPNQCNDMHGLHGHDVPDDCTGKTSAGLIGRADRTVAKVVGGIMASPSWKGTENDAIVITFDENDDDRPDTHAIGCCGSGPGEPGSPGGGWISTIVVANHGPRHFNDPTPYNHYSLLRTIEAAFGIDHYVGHAADTDKGVVTMTPLFAVTK